MALRLAPKVEYLDELKRIRVVTEPMLTDGVTIADLVYRPCDMRVFGAAGFLLVLQKGCNRMCGIDLGVNPPSLASIEGGVRKIQEIL